MKPTTKKLSLVGAIIGLQLVIVIGVLINGIYPLWTGREVALEVQPRDPRDLFRGDYARLTYDINSVPKSAFESDQVERPRLGEVVYVTLKEEPGRWTVERASTARPRDGLFLRGRVRSQPNHLAMNGVVRIEYGIEAYFAPKEKAQALERGLVRRGNDQSEKTWAYLMVASDGKAAIKEITSPG